MHKYTSAGGGEVGTLRNFSFFLVTNVEIDIYLHYNFYVFIYINTQSCHPLSSPHQFDNEYQFNSSVKTLLSRLPRQRYLKTICEELQKLKIIKK